MIKVRNVLNPSKPNVEIVEIIEDPSDIDNITYRDQSAIEKYMLGIDKEGHIHILFVTKRLKLILYSYLNDFEGNK